MTRNTQPEIREDQIHAILSALMEIVRGNFDVRLPVADRNSPVDAIHVAVNLTAAELGFGEARRKKDDARIQHLNRVLRAVRNANQIIVREKDRERLIRLVCESLIETRGYFNAWIALVDQSGELIMTAQAGLDDDFPRLIELLNRGQRLPCIDLALERRGVVCIEDPNATCRSCPLATKYQGRGGMAVRLEHHGKVFGALVVSVARDHLADEEERSLFLEVAEDVALALNGLAEEDRRKEAEAALRKSEEWWRSLVEHVPDLVIVTDVDGSIRYMNKVVPGLTLSEVIGTSIYDYVPSNDHEAMRSSIARVIATGEPSRYECEGTGPDKTLSKYSTRVNAIRRNGQTLSLILVTTDVTEQKKLEQQLYGARRMEAVGSLAGGVAHDFNNLLSVINSFSGFLLEGLDERDPAREDVQEIRNASERGANLTRQLLAFSRRQMIQPTTLDLNAVVTEMEKMLRRVIGEDINLIFAPGEKLGCVKADKGQIEQILMNLVVNARDAMPTGGKLTIETATLVLDEEYARRHVAVQPGAYVRLAVTDTGCGMDEKVRERIFEPFFTTKEAGKGTGLGLATVYGIVKQNNGNIWVYSEPGQGTTFKVYLPEIEVSGARIDDRVAPVVRVTGTETILLVEDDKGVRKAASRILRKAGYKVLDAESGGDALLIVEQHDGPIALVLTDVVMPRMSGRQLADRLATVRSNMAVLFMSGYTANAIAHHGVLESSVPFIEKPFNEDALLRKVREVLDKHDRGS